MNDPKFDIFTPAESLEIRSTFARLFGSSLRPGERFAVSGSNVEGRLTVRMEIADPDRSEVASFEAGHEVGGDDDMPLIDARAHALEFLHAAVDSYLHSDRWPNPHIDWREYTFEGNKVYFRGAVKNEQLEAAADALLAEADADE